MTIQSVEGGMAPRAPVTFAVALVVGALAGGAVSLASFYVARYGPSGDGWSFRGNGALAVYALVPALLAAGWTAVVLHRRRQSWLGGPLFAGLVGAGLATLDAALLPVFGAAADRTAGPVVLLTLLAWTIAAPAMAIRFPSAVPARRLPLAVSIGLAALWLVSVVAGLLAVGFLLPAGS
jgi:hypothetical protein